MSRLSGKTAIVTGASKGIGAAIAKALAADGASVVVNYASSKEGADAVVSEIESGSGKAIAVQADVSREAGAQALVDAALQEFGQLDIVVNNSGIYGFAGIEDISVEQYRSMFDLNVLGTILVARAAVPHLKEGASIINISSNITSALLPNSAVYSGTKAAVDAITGVLAKELGPRKIRVNAILPGMTLTEGTEATGVTTPEFIDQIVSQTPLGRPGIPSDIADAVTFLASDDARWITGERIAVSGGMR